MPCRTYSMNPLLLLSPLRLVASTNALNICLTNRKNDISTKVDRYLSNCSSKLSSLHDYPNIKQLYALLNTGLLGSVKRVCLLNQLLSLKSKRLSLNCMVIKVSVMIAYQPRLLRQFLYIHRVSKKLCIFVSVITSLNFHKF